MPRSVQASEGVSLCLLIASVTFAWLPSVVQAAPALRIEGTGLCPSRDLVCNELATLGLACDAANAAAWRVELNDQGGSTVMTMHDRAGAAVLKRELTARSCADRGTFAAIVVEGTFVELGEMPRPVANASRSPLGLASRVDTTQPPTLHLGVMAGAATGLDASVTRGELMGEVARQSATRWWGSVAFGLLTSSSLGIGADSVRLSGGRLQLRLGKAWRLSSGQAELGLIAGATLQEKSATQSTEPRPELRLGPEAGVVVGVTWPLATRLALHVEVAGIVAIVRDRLVIEGVGPVATEPWLQAVVRIGLRWRT